MQGSVEFSERIGRGTGHCGGTIEYSLQVMIVVLIEAAERRRPLGMLQLTVLDAVFPAGSRLQP
jgi:hypothetical protein